MELTRGILDTVTVLDDRLRLGGWVGALDPVPVAGFRAEVSGRSRQIVAHENRLPSPDIAQHVPHVFEPGNCRFFLDLARNPEEDLEDTLACVTPLLSSGQPGCALLSPVQPTVPAPTEEQVAPVGGGVYGGLEFLSYFVSLAGLKPAHDVLDIGCGVGRMAWPLAYFLDRESHYLGFDVVEEGIRWARDNITASFPNFEFQRLDIHNQLYNPSGGLPARDLEFPASDTAFDFAFLTSVFTHMQGSEVRHYIDEIARVLRPGARCFLTSFLIDDGSRSLMETGKSNHRFEYPGDDCYVEQREAPEAAVGFEDQRILEWLSSRNLELTSRYDGTWCGRSGLSYQDILIVQKGG